MATTSRAGRSLGAISRCFAVGRSSRSPRSSGTTTRMSVRWHASWPMPSNTWAPHPIVAGRHQATCSAWPAPTAARAARMTPSTASKRRSRGRPVPFRRPRPRRRPALSRCGGRGRPFSPPGPMTRQPALPATATDRPAWTSSSSAPGCSAGSVVIARRSRPGRTSRAREALTPPWPGSRSPSASSIANAIPPARSEPARPRTGSPSVHACWAGPCDPSRRTSVAAGSGSAGDSDERRLAAALRPPGPCSGRYPRRDGYA